MFPSYIQSVKSKKKTHKIRLLLFAAAFILLFVKVYDIKQDVFGGGGNNTEVIVGIEQGATSRQIAQALKDNKIIKYSLIFRLVSKAASAEENFRYGSHTLRGNMSYSEIINTVSKTAAPSDAITVTIPEGSEIKQTAEKLYQAFTDKGIPFDKERFFKECEDGEFDFVFVKDIKRTQNRLEGYLFPATYTFTSKTDEHEAITTMLQKLQSIYTQEYADRAAQLGLTMDQVLTLASIIEREGASVEEFKTVSSVFHNRLEKKMKLESCATVQYILGERKEILSIADTRIKSQYNTYLNFGLPAGPIASAGQAAIEAALFPAQTDYLYFRLKDGRHIFSKTYREHQQAE